VIDGLIQLQHQVCIQNWEDNAEISGYVRLIAWLLKANDLNNAEFTGVIVL
jgi:hypothetical protein